MSEHGRIDVVTESLVFTAKKTSHPLGPLGHALLPHIVTGDDRRWARCHTSPVYAPLGGGVFNPDHPRACPRCRSVVRKASR